MMNVLQGEIGCRFVHQWQISSKWVRTALEPAALCAASQDGDHPRLKSVVCSSDESPGFAPSKLLHENGGTAPTRTRPPTWPPLARTHPPGSAGPPDLQD